MNRSAGGFWRTVRLCIGLLLACWSVASAQVAPTAAISGAIVDQTGAVISGAAINVRSSVTGADFKVTSSENGTYTVPASCCLGSWSRVILAFCRPMR